MAFVTFMTGNTGRMLRIIAGIILMTVGVLVVKDTLGTVLSVVALIPIAGGLLDFCVVGAVLGYPFRGAAAREQLARERQSR
ncbi:MAG: DUF2892 domain-containing protein [Anaerolineae bacterium]|jgi:hypothetical protein|nr:DUF2892 domain-containing protein [Anaerolineae bacterium]